MILDLFVDGGFTGRVGGQSCAVAPGECFVMDMRDTFRVRLKQGCFVRLIMPRALFDHAVGTNVSMHGLVLSAGRAPTPMPGALHVADRRLQGLAERWLPSYEPPDLRG